jgi:hypothetical protein
VPAVDELRRVLATERIDAARRAAPDLIAESARSLREAEQALAERDRGRAAWMAALGQIQVEIATAEARRLQEDIARLASASADVEAELERLEALCAASGATADE